MTIGMSFQGVRRVLAVFAGLPLKVRRAAESRGLPPEDATVLLQCCYGETCEAFRVTVAIAGFDFLAASSSSPEGAILEADAWLDRYIDQSGTIAGPAAAHHPKASDVLRCPDGLGTAVHRGATLADAGQRPDRDRGDRDPDR